VPSLFVDAFGINVGTRPAQRPKEPFFPLLAGPVSIGARKSRLLFLQISDAFEPTGPPGDAEKVIFECVCDNELLGERAMLDLVLALWPSWDPVLSARLSSVSEAYEP
jgi:hypothetical protein